jgi:hypothetical protein
MERSARRLLRASKNAKRKIRHLLSFHAFPPSRDVSTVAEENFRVFWKGVEAKARVGEKRGGCASYLALEAGLVGEALEANLVERIGRVAASRKGAWRSAGASTREIRRAIGAGKKSRQRSAGGGFCRHKTDATCARDRDDASAKRT